MYLGLGTSPARTGFLDQNVPGSPLSSTATCLAGKKPGKELAILYTRVAPPSRDCSLCTLACVHDSRGSLAYV